jgi:hypothetical protein
MLFRNYSNRHLSYGHLSRKKQRWDASTNYDSISTEDEDDDKEEDTANRGGTSIQWNRRRLPNQWRRRSTLEDLLTKNLAVTLVKFLSAWIMMARRRRARRRRAMTSSVFRLNASCLQ